MALEPPSPDAFNFVVRVAQAYAKLIASHCASRASGLGGRLFYAGELDGAGRALVVAANIAGAATLAATADRAAQKQAMRDGVADFPVNSLDEALRILKNQLRKRETVAVCVALEPAAVEREMNERGVAPDLLHTGVGFAPPHPALLFREGQNDETDLKSIPALVVWRVDSASPKDLATLDETALSCLDADDWAARRWLQLSPRYLGRMAHGLRLLSTHREFAARLFGRLRARADRSEIEFAFEIRAYVRGIEDSYAFAPGEP